MNIVFLLTLTVGVLTSCSKEEDFENPPYKPTFFSENFETILNTSAPNNSISLEGWSNVSLNGGSKKWEALYRSDSSQYAQLSAFNSGETNMDTWLITPAINFDQTANEALVFSYKAAFFNGQAVSILASTNYDGNMTAQSINNATWTDLGVVLPDYLTNGYPSTFSTSPTIDLSGFNGNVYIAFRYVGSSVGTSTTYQLDNIKIFENK